MTNQITLVGNMGNRPKTTNFQNGSMVVRFDVATPTYKEGKQSANWHKVFAWGNMARFIESYGAKGKQIVVVGKLVYRTYISKEGKPCKVTEVEVRQVFGL